MRWLFPKIKVSTDNSMELNRKLLENYFEFVLPRWMVCGMLIILYMNLRWLGLPELEGPEIPLDIVIATLSLFFFAYITFTGWFIMKIVAMKPEFIDQLYKAVVGRYHKDN